MAVRYGTAVWYSTFEFQAKSTVRRSGTL